jgi:hypothetical protein
MAAFLESSRRLSLSRARKCHQARLVCITITEGGDERTIQQGHMETMAPLSHDLRVALGEIGGCNDEKTAQ